ncbi:MAG: methylated-DNA--[protein]-cysteine S-methyltransferase [Chloroflexi bacterium]|nr:methylated-DNA--[protein]-cysteine S-methyltransferase [Chloroflexota bacterium]
MAIEALLAGRPVVTPELDLGDRPAWDRRVLHAVAAIPWGTTVSYGEIARRVGSAGAARAVGGAVGRNPISLLVPCHRVIAADGTLGGYGGGAWGDHSANLEIKRDLLQREGVTARRRGR